MSRAHGRATLPGLDGYWSRLSDDQLLSTSFTADDPERLPDLREEEPPTDQTPIVEYLYDFTKTDHANIRCVHCKYPNHKMGIVLKLADGRRYLVGHECGAKLYGARFRELMEDFEGAKTRALLITRMRRLKAALPAFYDYLHELRRHPCVSAYPWLRDHFRKEMPRLWGELKLACHNDQGALIVHRQAHDPDAERQADEQYRRDVAAWRALSRTDRKKYARPLAPAKPIYKWVPEHVGRLPTATFFSERPFSVQDFHTIITHLEQLSSTAEINEKHLSLYRDRARFNPAERDARGSLEETNAFMKLALWQANDLLTKLETQIEQLAEPARLFRAPVLSMICRWANAHHDLRSEFVVIGKAIQETNSRGIVRTIHLPPGFSVPDLEGIEKFRDAINITG
jgi:hypothetical protein